MRASLCPGTSRVQRITVDGERTIGFMGEEARTYATPAMIRDIEFTCRELILEHADAGEDSVGMEVAMRHLAPTLMDMTVEIAVKVIEIDGRKIKFVRCDDQSTGSGNQECVHKLIDDDHVFALTATTSLNYAGASYVNGQGVPDIGGEPVTTAYDQYQHLYSIAGTYEPRNRGFQRTR